MTYPRFCKLNWRLSFERIEFEYEIEGHRLSKPKYVQQLAIQRLLRRYEQILPQICDFYQNLVPDFVAKLANLKMPEAATQVVLASLHSHWKLPLWFDDLGALLDRYKEFEHYKEEKYVLPTIDVSDLSKQIVVARDDALGTLGSGSIVAHIFEPKHNEGIAGSLWTNLF